MSNMTVPDRLAIDHVVIVENSPEEAQNLREICERSFRLPLHTTEVLASDSASILARLEQDLRRVPETAIVFLDLCLDNDERIHFGSRVAQRIRKLRPELPIIIYSERAEFGVFADLLVEGLVDHAVDKTLIGRERLNSDAFNSVVTRAIRGRRIAHGAQRAAVEIHPEAWTLGSDSKEWLLLELVSRIGRSEVGQLVAMCVEGAKSATLQYMAPGLSGSYVMRALIARGAGAQLNVVLKVSQDREGLLADYKHMEDIGGLPGRLLPRLRDEGVQSTNGGWHGYAMDFVTGSTLASEIETTGGQVVLREVFNRIRDIYARQQPETCEPFATLRWSEKERAATVVELLRLTPFVKRHQPHLAPGIPSLIESAISGAVGDKSLAQIKAAVGELPGVRQHGDLHFNNIMIENGGHDVTLIDWSRYGLYPLAMDFAKCEASFRLRHVDAADCAELDLARIPEWQKLDAMLHNTGEIEVVDDGDIVGLSIVAAVRAEAKIQMFRESSALVRERLLWWYQYCLFRSYLKGIGAGYVSVAKRLWAISAATGLAEGLTDL
jgi:hypothetical protein